MSIIPIIQLFKRKVSQYISKNKIQKNFKLSNRRRQEQKTEGRKPQDGINERQIIHVNNYTESTQHSNDKAKLMGRSKKAKLNYILYAEDERVGR